MKRNRSQYLVAAALVATLALAGCKKEEAAVAPPPPVAEPAPAPAAVTVSVASVELGNAVGPDMRVLAPTATFAPMDTIFAAVSTATSDPAGSVNGKLTAKWTYSDGQVVSEESQDINFAGSGVTDFQISKPDGMPAGKYKLEVSLDGVVVQTKEFEVK